MSNQRHHSALLALRRRLFGYACALCPDMASAEDLYQDAMLRAMSARSVPVDQTAFRVWVFRIMRNLWIDRLRAAGRLPELTTDDDIDTHIAINRTDDLTVNRLAVRQAFMKLAKPHRDVLALVDIAGFSYAEASELLNVPQGTIMSRISRARASLAHSLQDNDKVVALPLAQGKQGFRG
ncbi:MAG: RNA polymerase sigma factor [Rhodobacteraceae bacterium]|nr:RNA polymerase sigma factor [Paracoccaceae bacterium]